MLQVHCILVARGCATSTCTRTCLDQEDDVFSLLSAHSLHKCFRNSRSQYNNISKLGPFTISSLEGFASFWNIVGFVNFL